jgi:hypothetical protein
MRRGLLHQAEYRPLFSGHETFPLRYGWLKKAYDAVCTSPDNSENKSIFLNDEAIARFGVGKNMVKSMRHWAAACNIIKEKEKTGQLKVTNFGRFLFGSYKGMDPYLEHPGSLWLLHWNLCSGSSLHGIKTTWYWAFNYFSGVTFRRDDLVDGLMKLAEARKWSRVSRTTVQRDVECFVRTYESRPTGDVGCVEDNLESSLAELGLIRGLKGNFQFVRGSKRSLPDEVFIFALNSFWNQYGGAKTLSFEAIAHEPGSPGRVFLLDEIDLSDRLLAMEELTKGAYSWSETAGLKQAFRKSSLSQAELFELMRKAYVPQKFKEAV